MLLCCMKFHISECLNVSGDGHHEKSDLLMTMKRPMDPSSTKDWSQYDSKARKSNAVEALEELNKSRSPRQDYTQSKTWQPPTLRKTSLADVDKENVNRSRSKSPGVRDENAMYANRKTPSPLSHKDSMHSPRPFTDDSLDEVDGMRRSTKQYKTKDSLYAEGYGESRHHVGLNRESPIDGHRSPYDAQGRQYDTNFSSNYNKNKGNSSQKYDDRRSPLGDGKSSYDLAGRSLSGGKTSDMTGHRKSPTTRMTNSGKTSPGFEKQTKAASGRRTPTSGPSTDRDTDGRKTPSKSPTLRKGSILDMMEDDEKNRTTPKQKGKGKKTRKGSHLHSSDEDSADDLRYGNASPSRRSPTFSGRTRQVASPHGETKQKRQGNQQFDTRGRSPNRNRNMRSPDDDYNPMSSSQRVPRQSRKATRTPNTERDSSLCREVEKDPTLVTKTLQSGSPQPVLERVPKSQRKEKQLLDEVIDSIKDAQGDEKTMRFIDPDKTTEDGKEAKEERTHLKKYKPKPRYPKSPVKANSTVPQSPSFDSSTNIRDVIFQEWYTERQEKARKEALERKKKEKEEKEKKQKAELDKELESKASYDAWKENKSSYDQERAKKKMKEESMKKQKEEELLEKKKIAEQSYRIWKEDRDAALREKKLQKTNKESRQIEETEDEKNRKRKDSESAYNTWKGKKDKQLKRKERTEKGTTKDLEEEEKETQKERSKEAEDSYARWMERKEKQDQKKKEQKRQSRYTEAEYTLPAWSPASKTIPAGR